MARKKPIGTRRSRRNPDPCGADTPSFEQIELSLQNVIYVLGRLGGFWLIESDRITEWLRKAKGVPLNEQATALNHVRHQLAYIRSHPKEGLSQVQIDDIIRCVHDASTRIDQWEAALPDAVRAERHSLRVARKFVNARTRLTFKKNLNDARDKYAYFSLTSGNKSLQEIKNKINKSKKWQPLLSLQGVSAAAKRYALRQSPPLPWPVVQR